MIRTMMWRKFKSSSTVFIPSLDDSRISERIVSQSSGGWKVQVAKQEPFSNQPVFDEAVQVGSEADGSEADFQGAVVTRMLQDTSAR